MTDYKLIKGGLMAKVMGRETDFKQYTGNYFAASMVGYCPMKLYLMRTRDPGKVDAKLRHIFGYGTAFHHLLEKEFESFIMENVDPIESSPPDLEWGAKKPFLGNPIIEQKCGKKYPPIYIGGRYDFQYKGAVGDFKIKPKASVYIPDEKDIDQLCVYMDILGLDKGVLIYLFIDRYLDFCKEHCDLEEVYRQYQFHLDKARVTNIINRLGTVYQCQEGIFRPESLEKFEGPLCAYCDYQEECEKV